MAGYFKSSRAFLLRTIRITSLCLHQSLVPQCAYNKRNHFWYPNAANNKRINPGVLCLSYHLWGVCFDSYRPSSTFFYLYKKIPRSVVAPIALTSPAWTDNEKKMAIEQGSHPSAMTHQTLTKWPTWSRSISGSYFHMIWSNMSNNSDCFQWASSPND